MHTKELCSQGTRDYSWKEFALKDNEGAFSKPSICWLFLEAPGQSERRPSWVETRWHLENTVHWKEQIYANLGILSWGKIKLATANTIVVAGESFPAFKALWQPGDTAESQRVYCCWCCCCFFCANYFISLIVALLCSVSVCCRAKWNSSMCT